MIVQFYGYDWLAHHSHRIAVDMNERAGERRRRRLMDSENEAKY
jgi:hypothetical protein